jgi:transposase
MNMTIVEATRQITGGVDTHLDVHVAAALDHVGGFLGVESFAVGPDGYEALLAWLENFGKVGRVGVEGTGSYGAGLARFLAGHGITVIEVDRPNRAERRRSGKSDPLDATEAARAALSGRAKGLPKSRDGGVEAIRMLLVANRSARQARVKALVQMRHLVITAPDELQHRLKGFTTYRLVIACSRLRADRSSDLVVAAAKVALSSLAHRIQSLDLEIADLKARILVLVEQTAPDLLERFGVGPDTARRSWSRRRQPRTPALRSCVRAPLWRLADPRLVWQDERACPSRLRGQPPGELGTVADRHSPHHARSEDHCLLRAQDEGGMLQARCDPHLEALRRPRALSLLASRLKIAVVSLAHRISVVPLD